MPRQQPRRPATLKLPDTSKPQTAILNLPDTSKPVLMQQPSLTNIVKEGFAFGVGSSLARNVVDRFLPPGSSKYIDAKKEKPTSFEYIQCMEDSAHNHDACKDHLT